MGRGSYLQDTQHPWSCVIFVLPLLVIYETGLMVMPSQPEMLRNGADTWLRSALGSVGLPQLYWAPALLMGIFLFWSWLHRKDRPADNVAVWIGMGVESTLFALGLWGISRGLWPIVNVLGLQAALPASLFCQTSPAADPGVEQILSFVGAGIYEETLFRLLLYSGLMWIFHLVDFSALLSFVLAAVASALLFAGAHHLGPQGEPFENYIFLFRTVAGVYFALLFQLRGFAIAVGAHTGYDLLVGVLAN